MSGNDIRFKRFLILSGVEVLNNIDRSVAVLVNSCDKYSDIWPVFFQLFFKYWPDCPYPVFLGSNEKTYNDPRVTTLCVGPDKSWADSTQAMVALLPATNILWFLDDYLLWETVSTSKVTDLYERFLKLEANYLRMSPDGGSDQLKRIIDDTLLELLPGVEYRSSLDNAFWNREMFLNLLKTGESPWDMESAGSRRSDQFNGFYATRSNIFQRTNGLERGKWLRYNLPLLAHEGIAIPLGHPVMSRTKEVTKTMKRYIKLSLSPLRPVYRVLKGKSAHE
ncbi:MAG: hypothetical protein WCH30_05445 [Chlorobiaceae bacterium]